MRSGFNVINNCISKNILLTRKMLAKKDLSSKAASIISALSTSTHQDGFTFNATLVPRWSEQI